MKSSFAIATAIASLAVVSLSLTAPASAHHLWLEVENGAAKIYFGEFGENLREVSPGSLDKLQPKAKVGDKPVAVEKAANGFAVAGKLGAGESIVAEDDRYPLYVRQRDGQRSIYRPAARFVPDSTPRPAALELDVVPAGPGKYQVTFKGKPLPKTKVQVVAQSGWVKEVHTGDDGGIEVVLPWKGPYVLEVHHTDRTAGKRGEEAYDVINYVTSLTVLQPQGLEPVPASPAAKPH